MSSSTPSAADQHTALTADGADAPTDSVGRLDMLPEDAFRCVWLELLSAIMAERPWGAPERRMWHAFRIFTVSARLRALSTVVEALRLGAQGVPGWNWLELPDVRLGLASRSLESSLLAPYPWAARLCRLRELHVSHLSWGGAARLIALLPAWPELEQLDVRFPYRMGHVPSAWLSHMGPFQQFVNDLAVSLALPTVLPRLSFVWVGNSERRHCFGQHCVDVDDLLVGRHVDPIDDLDDSVLLERLRPTAALWFMAERAHHCRTSKLFQWRYELEHGADVARTHEGLTLLEWMHQRLGEQLHSQAGYRAVRELLRQHGAVDGGAECEPRLHLDVEDTDHSGAESDAESVAADSPVSAAAESVAGESAEGSVTDE